MLTKASGRDDTPFRVVSDRWTTATTARFGEVPHYSGEAPLYNKPGSPIITTLRAHAFRVDDPSSPIVFASLPFDHRSMWFHGGRQYNLREEMPETFEEMILRWNDACEDEVVSNYMPSDPEEITVRRTPPCC